MGTCLLVSVGFCLLSAAIDLFLHEDPEREGAWMPGWLRARGRATPAPLAPAAAAAEGDPAAAAELQLGGGPGFSSSLSKEAGLEKGEEEGGGAGRR